MKYLILALASISCLYVAAQNSEGKIVYERTINMHKRLPPEAEQFKAMVPEFQTSKMALFFNDHQSLYKAIQQEENQLPEASTGGGRNFSFRFGGGSDNSETFRDYNTLQIVESRELGPKMYLIEDTLQELKWKLDGDTMTINGYLCYKAITEYSPMAMFGMRTNTSQGSGEAQNRRPAGDSSNNARRESMNNFREQMMKPQKVEAWFTDAIATSAGPDAFYGLPGLILQLTIDEGTIVYKTVSLEPLAKNETVSVPNKGKKITREEYRDMMRQQMGGPGGPGGQRRMVIMQ